MKKLFRKPEREDVFVNNKIALKGGSYSIAVTVIVLAILVVVNVMVSVLPSSLTKLDISSAKLYSITSNTKVVVNALEEDVTIYWVVQADKEDSVIENLLSKYESLSSHITVVKKNPDAFPTFTAQYTSENVENNSLIVECGEKYRYISYEIINLKYEYISHFAIPMRRNTWLLKLLFKSEREFPDECSAEREDISSQAIDFVQNHW